MTEKQIERIKSRIDKLKKALAEDKRRWGGYHNDGQGIRYVITTEFIKIKDFKSGLKYLNWFDKNFPDDSGYPIFLFEATLILFSSGKLKEAEGKAHRTFFSNTYLFDKFLGKETLHLDKNEGSNWEFESLVEGFPYAKKDFEEFANWVEQILKSRTFLDRANEFIEIEIKLKNEPVGLRRSQLVDRLYQIKKGRD